MALYMTRNITHSAGPGYAYEASLIGIIRSLRKAQAMTTAQKQMLIAAAPLDEAENTADTMALGGNIIAQPPKDSTTTTAHVYQAVFKAYVLSPQDPNKRNRNRVSLNAFKRLSPNPNHEISGNPSKKNTRFFTPSTGAAGKEARVNLPSPGPGGKTIHHCPVGHGTTQACLKGGCTIPCPTCGIYISIWGGSKCRVCGSNARIEALRQQQEEAARKQAEAEQAEAERIAAENKKARKPKWSKGQREVNESIQRAAHDVNRRSGGGMFPVRAGRVGSDAGVGKNTGRVGSKAADVGWALPKLTDEELLTLDAATILYRYCEDLVWKM